MADVIRLDKVLVDLIKEYKELELADRQKDLNELSSKLSDSSYSDRLIRGSQEMVDSWSAKNEKDVLQYALIAAIHEIKFRNNW